MFKNDPGSLRCLIVRICRVRSQSALHLEFYRIRPLGFFGPLKLVNLVVLLGF